MRSLPHCGFLENAGAGARCARAARVPHRVREGSMRPRDVIANIHPRLAVVLHDLAMVWLAWIATNWLRYSFEPDPPPLAWFTPEIGIAVAAQGLVLWWTGLYKGLWRFASLPDLWNIVRAGVLGAIAIAVALFLYKRLATVPRAALVIYPALLVVFLG